MNAGSWQVAAKLLSQAESLLLVSHVRPDGDAVGSLLGLGQALLDGGKVVQMVISDGVPAQYSFLPGCENVKKRPQEGSEVTCLLDCSDEARIGFALPPGSPVDINIDHHITNQNFARVNLVDTRAVATAEILSELIPLAGLKISHLVASALLTGIITDTIGFQTNNMTPKALRTAAGLMEAGANISELYHQSLTNRSYEAIRFWGMGLSKLERDEEIIWTTLTMQDRKSASYPGRDDADLINVLSSVDSAAVYLIFVEQPKGKVKVSWRSQSGYDVTSLAASFGGGGHPSAAGAEIAGALSAVKDEVLRATRMYLAEKKE